MKKKRRAVVRTFSAATLMAMGTSGCIWTGNPSIEPETDTEHSAPVNPAPETDSQSDTGTANPAPETDSQSDSQTS